jgi:CheY-like chemotaxis protein
LPILICTGPSAESLMLLPERLRILVADDERIIADTLAMILSQNGYDAVPVYGGRLAVEKARHWLPDLLLADVNMPELNGIHAAIEICAMFPGCRVLLFSGEPGANILVREAGKEGHRFEFLEKPISPLDLLRRIRHLRAA